MIKKLVIFSVGIVLFAATAGAAMTGEQKCLSGRAKAVGKFEACVRDAFAKGYTKDQLDQSALGRCADVLDADNSYNSDFAGTEEGSLYDQFLAGLNTGSLDGSQSWRIPTMVEQLSVVKETVPGSLQGSRYWSSTANPLDSAAAWTVRHDGFGGALIESTPRFAAMYARAVRGGY